MSFGSVQLARAYMYALCVSGAVNTQGFEWKFFYALYINFHSFIHSFAPLRIGAAVFISVDKVTFSAVLACLFLLLFSSVLMK